MADPTPTAPPRWWDRYRPTLEQVAIYLLTALLGVVAARYGFPPPPRLVEVEVVREVPAPVAADTPPADPRFFGWADDPDAVKAVTGVLPIKSFSDTPAFAEDTPDHVYLWDAAKKVTGGHIPTRNQGAVGSCVAFGSACAVEYLECVQIAMGRPELFKAVSQEVIYGGSRVQIGGGRIRGDGSVGAWAAQWAEKYGQVARGKYGSTDLTAYNEARCRQYGSTGCPADLIPTAKERPVKSVAPVRTTDELKAALASGYPVSVASSVGFGQSGPYTRNALGQLRASGTWAHQMCFIGYDNTAGAYCMNSWGPTWVSGPPGPGDPPPGGFYVAWATAQRMLDAGDSFAYGDIVGFPGRKIPDWFLRSTPARPLNPFARRPVAALAAPSSLSW
jgi:hypothetical protein